MADQPTIRTHTVFARDLDTVPVTTIAGDFLVIVVHGRSGASPGIDTIDHAVDGALTEVFDVVREAGADRTLSIWYLANPTPGTQNVVVTWDGAGPTQTRVAAVYVRGVNQAAPEAGLDTDVLGDVLWNNTIDPLLALGVLILHGYTVSATPSALTFGEKKLYTSILNTGVSVDECGLQYAIVPNTKTAYTMSGDFGITQGRACGAFAINVEGAIGGSGYAGASHAGLVKPAIML